jgi:hypothetical protein
MAIEQPDVDDRTTNRASSGIAVTLMPLSNNASVTLKSSGSKMNAPSVCVSAPHVAALVSFTESFLGGRPSS